MEPALHLRVDLVLAEHLDDCSHPGTMHNLPRLWVIAHQDIRPGWGEMALHLTPAGWEQCGTGEWVAPPIRDATTHHELLSKVADRACEQANATPLIDWQTEYVRHLKAALEKARPQIEQERAWLQVRQDRIRYLECALAVAVLPDPDHADMAGRLLTDWTGSAADLLAVVQAVFQA